MATVPRHVSVGHDDLGGTDPVFGVFKRNCAARRDPRRSGGPLELLAAGGMLSAIDPQVDLGQEFPALEEDTEDVSTFDDAFSSRRDPSGRGDVVFAPT